MKASMHAARTNRKGQAFDVKHHDRSFEQKKSNDYDKHINPNGYFENWVYLNAEEEQYLVDSCSLRDFELLFYQELFQNHLDFQNEKHVKAGHRNRCKTIEDVYTNARTCPQETILQIGKNGEYKDLDKFKMMVQNYCRDYNRQYNNNSHILSVSLHADETSIHAHVRRVFYIKDENNNLELAQNKALEQMGFELPDPTRKRTKYNNRLQTFTDAMRENWFDEIERVDKSLFIDKKPSHSISKRHLEKLDYQVESVRNKIIEKAQVMFSIDKDLEAKKSDYKKVQDEIEKATEVKKRYDNAAKRQKERYEHNQKVIEKQDAKKEHNDKAINKQTEKIEAQKIEYSSLEAQNDDLRRENEYMIHLSKIAKTSLKTANTSVKKQIVGKGTIIENVSRDEVIDMLEIVSKLEQISRQQQMQATELAEERKKLNEKKKLSLESIEYQRNKALDEIRREQQAFDERESIASNELKKMKKEFSLYRKEQNEREKSQQAYIDRLLEGAFKHNVLQHIDTDADMRMHDKLERESRKPKLRKIRRELDLDFDRDIDDDFDLER